MDRPTVLHVARDWVRASEGFVADTVRYGSATRPVVLTGRRVPTSPAAGLSVPVLTVDEWLGAWRGRPGHVARARVRRWAGAALAARYRADVVHAHFGYWAETAEAVARRAGVPWSVSLHGHDLLVEARADPSARARLARADLVVVPSSWLAGRAVDAGVDPDRLRVLPSGIDLGRLAFRARGGTDHPVVTFAGRFVPKKGVLDAIDALAAVQRMRPEVQAVVVGTGPMAAEVDARIRATGLRADVRDGGVPGAVADALQATDLLVTASRTAPDGDAETLGLVNLEAQACGVPVVTTRHGGIPEAVAPEGARLVDEGDVDALAAALDELLDRPERWAAMGHAGRRHVAEHFEVGACVADLERQWSSLARSGRPAPQPRPVTTPSVSVVMVTHQRRELVGRTLHALAAQTLPPKEVVVVDNATTDGTSELLEDWVAGPDLQLTVLRSEHNASTSVARNRAAAVTTADVVAFTDDDCRPVPTWLEALAASFREDTSLVQGRTTADPSQQVEPLSRTQWTPAEYGLYETCNIAYRRDVFDRVGGFDEGLATHVARVLGPRLERFPFGEDTDLGWRVRRLLGGTRYSSTAVVHHHVFPPAPRLLVRRAAISAGFPVLVDRVPELRREFLWRRLFLGRPRLEFLAMVAGVVAAPRRPAAALAAAPYLWTRLQPLRRGRKDRLRALPVHLARDAVEETALLYGSVRARTPVL